MVSTPAALWDESTARAEQPGHLTMGREPVIRLLNPESPRQKSFGAQSRVTALTVELW